MSILYTSAPIRRVAHKIFYESRATIRGYWPEPITQQTLNEFLEDINYFERPKKIIDIASSDTNLKKSTYTKNSTSKTYCSLDNPVEVDVILDKLSIESEPPPLNYDDVRLTSKELGHMALEAGIYRDLFSSYQPNRGHIEFTPEQAKNLSRLVPHYWITDQPFSRVHSGPKNLEQTYYFEPTIGISAKFIHKVSSDDDHMFAHTSYHGNIIPACDALERPSITLDGKYLNTDNSDSIPESKFQNWNSGTIELVNFANTLDKYYSVVFLNLDSLHENTANLHWMVANINTSGANVKYDEICDYLPTFGVKGFGYSRYVFLVFQHDKPLDTVNRIEGYSLNVRKFCTKDFIEKHKPSSLRPVGVSWFQTSWDSSSNSIFHDYLNMKAPVYEHVQSKLEPKESRDYVGGVPFNSYLDHHRTKKSINEQVLLERLKNVEPDGYRDQYVKSRVPSTIFQESGQPSWMHIVTMKKKNKVGYWRGLRPASAILPLDNNADLDYPIRPRESSRKIPPEFPNKYRKITRYQLIKDMPISKPPNEHQAIFIQDDHEIHLSKVMKVMESFKQPDGEVKK